MELQELEDKVELADLRVKQAEKAYKSQQAQALADQKAIDDYDATLAGLKVESVNAVLAGDMAKRRSLETQIRTMTHAGGPSLPTAQVEAQKATEDALKGEYATLTRITPSGADQALQIRQKMNEIENSLRFKVKLKLGR